MWVGSGKFVGWKGETCGLEGSWKGETCGLEVWESVDWKGSHVVTWRGCRGALATAPLAPGTGPLWPD